MLTKTAHLLLFVLIATSIKPSDATASNAQCPDVQTDEQKLISKQVMTQLTEHAKKILVHNEVELVSINGEPAEAYCHQLARLGYTDLSKILPRSHMSLTCRDVKTGEKLSIRLAGARL